MRSAKPSVMVDLNILLDVMEKREPWAMDSARTCAICGSGQVIGFVSPHALTTIYYIVRKRGGKDLADKAIDWVLTMFNVAGLGASEFKRARSSKIDDFEDAVVEATAVHEKCAFIVTRNDSHFRNSSVSTLTPSDFVRKFGRGKTLWT